MSYKSDVKIEHSHHEINVIEQETCMVHPLYRELKQIQEQRQAEIAFLEDYVRDIELANLQLLIKARMQKKLEKNQKETEQKMSTLAWLLLKRPRVSVNSNTPFERSYLT